MNPLTPRETLVELMGLIESVIRDRTLFQAMRDIIASGDELRDDDEEPAPAGEFRVYDLAHVPTPHLGACNCPEPYVASVLADTWDGSCGRCGGDAAPRLLHGPQDAADAEREVEQRELEQFMNELQGEEDGY